jgi:hypothetical protein
VGRGAALNARLGDPVDSGRGDSARGDSFDGTVTRGSARWGEDGAGAIVCGAGRASRGWNPLVRDGGTRDGVRDGTDKAGRPAPAPAVAKPPPTVSNAGDPDDPRGTAYPCVGARIGWARAKPPDGAAGACGRAVNCDQTPGATACADTACRATRMFGAKARAGTTVQPRHG